MKADDDDTTTRAADRIAAVKARFVAGLGEKTAALAALAHAAAGPDVAAASAAADGLRLGLHNLAGSSPTLGFVELGARASELERRMIEARTADGRLPQAAAEALARDIAALANDPA